MGIIKSCSCSSEYQDRMYGKGNRVHNECGGKNSKGLRCTICGTKKE